ncbi:MAG TPA: phosphatidylserine decarboxylase family protein, partial [Thermoguttaceae bacterium]
METTETAPVRTTPQSLPDNFRSVQPGGGLCYRIELAWGRWRRWWLKRFRSAYIRRMAEQRHGSCDGAPHEILDPRDLKYCRNLCQCDWEKANDPFHWRDRLPFARWSLAELQLMGWPLLAVTIWAAAYSWSLALAPGILLCLIVYFFRDPPRVVPREPGLI